MQELTFVGLSEDGAALTLALPDGRKFALPIDERLRAATRAGGRPGQLAIPTDTLRPRDIQARVRSGASPEEVAELSGWPLDRVEAFAVPVLQERSFIADQARDSLIRYRDGEMALREVVAHRLADRGVDETELRWDAWKREDEVWIVLLAYPAGRGDQVATWTFDTDSRSVHPADEEARWLSEYRSEDPVAAPEPAIPDEPTAQIVNLNQAKPRQTEPEPGNRHPALRRPQAEAPQSVAPTPEPSGKRASVPSWDEILFGGSPTEE